MDFNCVCKERRELNEEHILKYFSGRMIFLHMSNYHKLLFLIFLLDTYALKPEKVKFLFYFSGEKR